MATLNSVMTKLQNLLSSLCTKMGTTYTTFTAAINALPSKKTADNVTVNEAKVTTPSGIYFSAVEKTVPNARVYGDAGVDFANVTQTASSDKLSLTEQSSKPTSNYIEVTTGGSVTLQPYTDCTTSGYVKTGVVGGAEYEVDLSKKKYYSFPNATFSTSGNTVKSSAAGYVPANTTVGTVATGSATTPATTITANPSLSTTYTSGSGYKMSVSKTQSVTPTVSAGYVSSGTEGTITVSGYAYVPQSSTGNATTSTTDAATRTIGYGQQTTIGAGYYPSARIIRNSVSAGKATTPATTITKNPTISVSSSGVITASVSGTQSVTPSVTPGYVASGTSGTITVSGSATKELTIQAAKTITPTTSNQTAVASGRYTTGTVTVKGDANLVAGNIKNGVSIFGVVGTYGGSGNVQTTSVIVDTENTLSNGYHVDVYYTILENGQIVNAHQCIDAFAYVVLANVVKGSVITFKSDFYLDDSTNMLFGEATQGYQWAYAYVVSDGSYFMFWE